VDALSRASCTCSTWHQLTGIPSYKQLWKQPLSVLSTLPLVTRWSKSLICASPCSAWEFLLMALLLCLETMNQLSNVGEQLFTQHLQLKKTRPWQKKQPKSNVWMLSNWKHCEDQQKEIIFHLFPEHWPMKQFQQFTTNQSLFAV